MVSRTILLDLMNLLLYGSNKVYVMNKQHKHKLNTLVILTERGTRDYSKIAIIKDHYEWGYMLIVPYGNIKEYGIHFKDKSITSFTISKFVYYIFINTLSNISRIF